MTEQEEYKYCVEQIEIIRAQRECILKNIQILQKQAKSTNNSEEICKLQEQDEELGAKMHQLTIRRNLLEP